MSNNSVNQCLDESEASIYLSISRSTLRQARMNGGHRNRLPPPPYVKVGRRVIYILADLNKWLEDHKRISGVPSTADPNSTQSHISPADETQS